MRYIESKTIEKVESFCPDTGDYAYIKGQKGYLYIDGVLLEKDDAPLELSLRGKYMYVWYGSGMFELYEGHTLLNSIERNVILLNEQTQYIPSRRQSLSQSSGLTGQSQTDSLSPLR